MEFNPIRTGGWEGCFSPVSRFFANNIGGNKGIIRNFVTFLYI